MLPLVAFSGSFSPSAKMVGLIGLAYYGRLIGGLRRLPSLAVGLAQPLASLEASLQAFSSLRSALARFKSTEISNARLVGLIGLEPITT